MPDLGLQILVAVAGKGSLALHRLRNIMGMSYAISFGGYRNRRSQLKSKRERSLTSSTIAFKGKNMAAFYFEVG